MRHRVLASMSVLVAAIAFRPSPVTAANHRIAPAGATEDQRRSGAILKDDDPAFKSNTRLGLMSIGARSIGPG